MFLKQGNYQVSTINNCILEYIKKDKSHFADFFCLASEAWIVCTILSKVKNELKIHIIYICDFEINISITHVYILMEELICNFEINISITHVYILMEELYFEF